MAKIWKATIGIRPINKMFRVLSVGGSIIDALIGLRGGKVLNDDYFDTGGISNNRQAIRISNESQGNYVNVSVEDVVFIKDFYATGKQFDLNDFLAEFRAIWSAIDSVLKVRDIRRIGFVGEHRFPAASGASATLLRHLTKLEPSGHPDKFSLRFETRSFNTDGSVPDEGKGAFVNVIREYYDASQDVQHPEPKFINANLDAQRYFAPAFNGDISGEFLRLYNKTFVPATKDLTRELKELGLIYAAKEEAI